METHVEGSHNYVVNVVTQGGVSFPLPMRTTVWTDTPQDLCSVAALLRWNTRLSPLLGRDAEMAELRSWANTDHPVSIKLLHAPGGQGKTRLAAEFVDDLKGWRHGWIDLVDFSKAEALTWQGQCLLLVDYPEHQPVHLERLTQAVERVSTDTNDRLRILLVAREAHAIQSVMQSRQSAAWLAPPMALPELLEDSGHALLKAALERLSVLHCHTQIQVTEGEFEVWRARHDLHRSPLFATALAIDLATNASVGSDATRWLSGPDLLARLVDREILWWEKTALGYGAPAGALTTVMAWATLSGQLMDQDINQTLAVDQDWTHTDRRSIHAALAAVCRRAGAHGWAPIEPDLLAARFIDGWLDAATRQGRERQEGVVAQALFKATDVVAFDAHLHRLHMLAYDQTVRLSLRKPDDLHRLERVLMAWSELQPDLIQAFVRGLARRAIWPGLSWLAAQVSLRHVALSKEGGTDGERAERLNNWAIDMVASGDRPGALEAVQEAVQIYRRLVKALPAFERHLAGSLNNLANILGENGDSPAALPVSREAVQLFRRLAQLQPAALEPELARSLNTLAGILSANGNLPAALQTSGKAVQINRRLAQAQPSAHEPELARSLITLSGILSANGDFPAALEIAREAVEINQRLAQAEPASYEPDLAGSLTSFALRLRDTGDLPAALVAARKAVEIHRRLAHDQPAAYEPRLAGSLTNLADVSLSGGDSATALVTSGEAVEIYRRLATSHPAVYEPNLAGSLSIWAISLVDSGDAPSALASAQDAEPIFRRLAEDNPVVYEPAFAENQKMLASIFIRTGNPAGALAPSKEAVLIFCRLAHVNPAVYEPCFAESLNLLAISSSGTGDRSGGLTSAKEAVTINRGLAFANPTVYAPNLAMSLGTCMECYAALGQWPQACETGDEALCLFSELAQRWPGKFATYRDETASMLETFRKK